MAGTQSKSKRLVPGALIAAGVGFFVFWAILWVIMVPIGDRYLPLLLGRRLEFLASNPFCIVAILTVGAAVCATFIYQVVANAVNVVFARTLAAFYAIGSVMCIMLKSRGVSGVNFDPSQIVGQFVTSPAVLLFNVVIFIPAGMLLHLIFNKPARPFMIALALILIMETSQAVFHLGIFDVVDIITNLMGFTIGYLIVDAFLHSGHRIKRSEGHYVVGKRQTK